MSVQNPEPNKQLMLCHSITEVHICPSVEPFGCCLTFARIEAYILVLNHSLNCRCLYRIARFSHGYPRSDAGRSTHTSYPLPAEASLKASYRRAPQHQYRALVRKAASVSYWQTDTMRNITGLSRSLNEQHLISEYFRLSAPYFP